MENELEKLCKELEHFVTEEWAVRAILEKEILTTNVFDPCSGSGVMAKVAKDFGYNVATNDIEDWGFPTIYKQDFLSFDGKPFANGEDFTVFMNPPFSKAEKFVDKAFQLGARKVICFQRFSWYEGSYDTGKRRGQWWEHNRPARIWICGDRVSCWRFDLPTDKDGDKTDHDGKKLSQASTSHAWFVWERGHLPSAITGHVFKTRG
mgnify:CR=1 FL=1